MTDLEFQILDELYFLIHYTTLENRIKSVKLKTYLKEMVEKEWISIFKNDNEVEIEYHNANFEDNFKSYYYLATKKGLLKHNSN